MSNQAPNGSITISKKTLITLGSAVIVAKVPSNNALIVDADGADVFVDGKKVVGKSTLLERQSTPKLLVRAESGRKIKSVVLDNKNITSQFINGQYTLERVITEHKLKVTTSAETIPFEKKSH